LTMYKVRKWVKLSIMSNGKVFSMLFLNISWAFLMLSKVRKRARLSMLSSVEISWYCFSRFYEYSWCCPLWENE
jgi:hypothetical protein